MAFAAERKWLALAAESGGKEAIGSPLTGASGTTLTRTESALRPSVRRIVSTLGAAVRARVAQAGLGASKTARLPRRPANRNRSLSGAGSA